MNEDIVDRCRRVADLYDDMGSYESSAEELREAAAVIEALRKDLSVAVDALRQADGAGVIGHTWYPSDDCKVHVGEPDILRRLLVEGMQ